MTALCHFPTPPAYAAQLRAEACRREIVIAARAILRSAANHDDAILIEACHALQDWGDWMDHLEADAMLLALRLRAHRQRQDAKKPRPVIRTESGQRRFGAFRIPGPQARYGVVLFGYALELMTQKALRR